MNTSNKNVSQKFHNIENVNENKHHFHIVEHKPEEKKRGIYKNLISGVNNFSINQKYN